MRGDDGEGKDVIDAAVHELWLWLTCPDGKHRRRWSQYWRWVGDNGDKDEHDSARPDWIDGGDFFDVEDKKVEAGKFDDDGEWHGVFDEAMNDDLDEI